MKSYMSTYDTSGIVQNIDDLITSNLSIKLSRAGPSESSQKLQWRRQDTECMEGEPIVDENSRQFAFVRILNLKPSFES